MSLVSEVASIQVDDSPQVPINAVGNSVEITDALTTPAEAQLVVPNQTSVIQIETPGVQGPAGPPGSGEGGAGPHNHDDMYYTDSEVDSLLTGYAFVNHSHPTSDVTGLQAALDEKASAVHLHVVGDITDLQSILDGKQAAGSYVTQSTFDVAMLSKSNTSHTHFISGVTGLQDALDNKSETGHGHIIADVSGLQAALDGKADVGTSGDYVTDAELQAGLDTRAPTSHSHLMVDVTGLQAALDAKQATGDYATNSALTSGLATKANNVHNHTISQVTSLQGALDAKSDTSHTHDDRYYTETEADGRFVRTVNGTSPDASGNVTVIGGGGGSDSWTYAIATADTANSNTATPVAATGLSINNLPDGLYEVIGTIQCTSVATTNGPRVGIATSGTGASVVVGMVGSNGLNLSASVWPGSNQLPNFVASTNAPTTGGNFVGTFIQGTIRATSMNGSVYITIVPEVAGEVKVKADSFLRFRRIGN